MARAAGALALSRERIGEEALRLFAKNGVERTTMRDIAAALGVTEPAIYRHFPGKEEMFDAVFLAAYARIAREIAAADASVSGFRRAAEAVVAMFTTMFDEERDLFTFVLLDQHRHLPRVADDAKENPVSALRDMFRRAIEAGDLPKMDPDLAAAVSLGVVVQAALFTHYGRLKGPLRRRTKKLAAAAIAALYALGPEGSVA